MFRDPLSRQWQDTVIKGEEEYLDLSKHYPKCYQNESLNEAGRSNTMMHQFCAELGCLDFNCRAHGQLHRWSA